MHVDLCFSTLINKFSIIIIINLLYMDIFNDISDLKLKKIKKKIKKYSMLKI